MTSVSLVLAAPSLLSDYALDLAIAEVIETRAALVPFVVSAQGGERRMHRFETPYSGQSTAAARYFLRSSADLDQAVLVWDGYVTVAGRRVDAVIAETYTAGAESSEVTARRYRPARLFSAPLALGETLHVGEGHPLF